MHRSRPCAVLVDCSEETFSRTVEFWSAVLGQQSSPRSDPRYVSLGVPLGRDAGLEFLLQSTAPERQGIHLDIETDDVGAEVRRLEQLGARRREALKNWVVMEDPSGHPFCVVPPHRSDFPAAAKEWP